MRFMPLLIGTGLAAALPSAAATPPPPEGRPNPFACFEAVEGRCLDGLTPEQRRAAEEHGLRSRAQDDLAQAIRAGAPRLIASPTVPIRINAPFHRVEAYFGQDPCRSLFSTEPSLSPSDSALLTEAAATVLRDPWRGITSPLQGIDWRDVASVRLSGVVLSVHRPATRRAVINLRFADEAAAARAAASMSTLQRSCDDSSAAPTDFDHASRILAKSLADGVEYRQATRTLRRPLRPFRLLGMSRWDRSEQCRSIALEAWPRPISNGDTIRVEWTELTSISVEGRSLNAVFGESDPLLLVFPDNMVAMRAMLALTAIRTACARGPAPAQQNSP